MTENIRGQVSLDAGGKTYTLQFTTNAMCRLEELTGLSPEEISSHGARGKTKITLIRALVWAGLIESHPDVSVEDAGRIIDDAGLVAAIAGATKAYMEARAITAKANGAASPRKAVRAGIGASS